MNWQLLSLGQDIYTNVFANQRYLLYLEGLKNTLLMAVGGVLIGTLIGVLLAIIKVYAVDTPSLKPLNFVADLYITVIRGTPVVVQLMIFYFVVFSFVQEDWAVPVAMLSFGINSGAYVAEIIRAGIQSIDRGQTEAGRSLGLSKNVTMRYIVLPQAVKNILPALFNEFIALVKETSVAPLIAVRELTMVSTVIKSRTFNAFIPLITVALIYLTIVLALTAVQKRLERRMNASDQR